MAKIFATRPILYCGRVYEPGAQLPATDTRMVKAWLTHGSAREIAPAENSDPAATGATLPEAEKTETEETEETEQNAPAAPPIPAPAVRGRATKRQG